MSNHILESSLGLTFGGLLLKLIDKACKQIVKSQKFKRLCRIATGEQNDNVSDAVSDITEIPHYDQE
jgi:hypothetical protein